MTMANDSQTHWSFQRPARPELPALDTLSNSIRNPIDRFVFQRLETAGLEPAPEADRLTLVRRAYFDLLGLPPTPEQFENFVRDEAPDAWSRLIDKLLASKHYGERWGRHWLDVVRYADSGGYETDIYYRNAWRYRDYVVKSFNDDKPYDIFVQEQIAGDELRPDNLDLDPRRVYAISDEKRRHLEARIGTGFYTLGPRVHESGLDAHRLAYETLTDWVDTTASAFMGLTLGCARCHEHKFDPLTQEDYFSMQAIFSSAREVELPLWTSMGEADWRQSYPRVLAVGEARKAYRLFAAEMQGKELSPEQQARKQELLAAIGNAGTCFARKHGRKRDDPLRRADAHPDGQRARPRTPSVNQAGPPTRTRGAPKTSAAHASRFAGGAGRRNGHRCRIGTSIRCAQTIREVADSNKSPADGPCDGESNMALALRSRYRRDSQRLRHNGTVTFAPETARLARGKLRREWLEDQGIASLDHELGRLSPEQPVW